MIGITSTAKHYLNQTTESNLRPKDTWLKLWVLLINYRSAIGLCGQYGYFSLSSLVSGKVLLRSSMVIWSKGIMFLNISSCQRQTVRREKIWFKCFKILNLIKSNHFIYEQSFTYKHSQTYFGFGTSFRHWAANVHFCASALLLLLSAGYSILIVSAAIIIYYKYMTWVHVLACTLD